MRSFIDNAGQAWDVAVGKESYGNLVLLFAPRDEEGYVRKTVMGATSLIDAERELRTLTEQDLQRRLEHSEEWD
ncbi:hypothetical protein HUS23_12895 [Ectothiorhodospiraceae bacterium 2226]|nr:hypothetical protein HUS23_12895 [Ectothiorhodospiraceae bacterium 2226]